MNIPIVQGTAVPQKEHQQYYSNATNAYHTIEDGDGAANNGQQQQQQPQHDNQYKDVAFGIAFILHLLAAIGLILYNITVGDAAAVSGAGGILTVVAVTIGASLLISSLALSLMIRYPTEMIKLSLVCSVLLGLASAVFSFITGQVMIGVLCLVVFLVGCCYAKMVWFRIPFAAGECLGDDGDLFLYVILHFLMFCLPSLFCAPFSTAHVIYSQPYHGIICRPIKQGIVCRCIRYHGTIRWLVNIVVPRIW
jgi:hypothetical protein